MRKLKEQITDIIKEIESIMDNNYFNLEIRDGKIIKIEYDDTKLTSQQKTNLENYIINNNPNLI